MDRVCVTVWEVHVIFNSKAVRLALFELEGGQINTVAVHFML